MASDDPKPAIDAYLAEYNSLRGEQMTRLESQNQAFNFLLAVIAAAGGTVVTCLNSKDYQTWQSPLIAALGLLLPLVAGPLGCIFFDNEMAIFAIGSRLYSDVRTRLIEMVGDDRLFGDALSFAHLNPNSPRVHAQLSSTRWVIFLVPTVLPTLGVALVALLDWRACRDWLAQFHAGFAWAMVAVGVLAFVFDVLMCMTIFRAIRWSFTKYRC